MATSKEVWLVVCIWVLALVISAFDPTDRLTWFLEVLPVMVAAPLLVFTKSDFPLSRILFWMIFIHGPVLVMGGHYTYAEVPVGFYFQDVFDFERNPYDRIGHFWQGFVPALLTREILLRKTPLVLGKMFFLMCISIPLAFSAFYELIEWWAAIALDQNAEAFLGTQGDLWDTQSDMFMALIGAITAYVILSKLQGRQLTTLQKA
jgi:putative membrane protein